MFLYEGGDDYNGVYVRKDPLFIKQSVTTIER